MTAFQTQTQTQSGPNPYLRTKVLTASPEQLRLMLIEGAIKFARQGRHALTQRDFEGMYNGLSRAQKIVLELSNSLNAKADPELCERLTALYNYLYRRLVDGNMERDTAAIDEVVNLLEYERETWVLAMKKLAEVRGTGSDPVADARAAMAANSAQPAEVLNPIATIGQTPPPPQRFSAQG